MKIKDYESGRELNDVDIRLSQEEAEELLVFLSHILKGSTLMRTHLSEIRHGLLEKEITISVDRPIAA